MRRTYAFLSVLALSTLGCALQSRSQVESPPGVPPQTRKAHGDENPERVADTDEVLKPYLGKWRPTSHSEQQNIGSLRISRDGLELEVGPALKYEVVRKDEAAVIVRVIDRIPPTAFPALQALAFSIVATRREGSATSPPQTREVLYIFWCEGLEQLSQGTEGSACSKNAYIR